jgi:calnexin
MILFLIRLAVSDFEFPSSGILFFESFDSRADFPGWSVTSLPNYTGEWKVRTPPAPRSDTFERLLTLMTPRSYSAISTRLSPPISPIADSFIIQYEVRFLSNVTCTGAYLKLFSNPNFDPATLSNETRHFMMFGPDVCADKNRLAFYFHHTHPASGASVEKSVAKPPTVPKDNMTHLYTCVIRSNGSISFMIDNRLTRTLEFESAFDPPIVPPLEIPDPTVVKPVYWDDRQFVPDDTIPTPKPDPRLIIPDPRYATPPPGWLEDEPWVIPDPNMQRPDTWDDELFGEWKARQIDNPKCANAPGCGPYSAPFIANPNHPKNYRHPRVKNPFYRGPWTPPTVSNPIYFYDPKPYLHWPNVTGLGFELWSVDGRLGFNNILLANNETAVIEWNRAFFSKRAYAQKVAADPGKAARVPKPRTKKIWLPLGVLGVAIWQVCDSWRDLYASNHAATLALTIAVLLVPLLAMWWCARRGGGDDSDEEEPAAPEGQASTPEETK